MAKLAKNVSDLSAISFLVIAVLATFAFEVCLVLPHIHDTDVTVQWFHTFNGLFIIFNVLSNLYALMTSDSSTAKLMLPSVLRPNWRFCWSCEANSPPRSFHCHICDKCVLKRDHHCVFSGCCIGYKNFRFYYGLLIYISLGCLYASVLNQFFIWDALGGISWTAVGFHLLPFPFWMFGKISFSVMLFTFISIINICGFLFAAALLYYHGKLLINNQTTYEKNHGITHYNLGHWKTNVVESLGHNWLAALLLSPLISSPLPRNGIDFPTFKERSNCSNKSK